MKGASLKATQEGNSRSGRMELLGHGFLQSLHCISSLSSHSLFIIVCVLVTQSCSLCDPMNCSPPGSSVHRILQARILEWVAISSTRGSSRPRDQNLIFRVSCIGRRVLPITEPPGKPIQWSRNCKNNENKS